MDQKNVLEESKNFKNLSTQELLYLSRLGILIPIDIFIQRFNSELNPKYLDLIDVTTPEDKLISTVEEFGELYRNDNYLNLSPEDFFVFIYTRSGGILPDSFKLDAEEWVYRPQYPLIRAIAKKDLNLVKLAVESLFDGYDDKDTLLYLQMGFEEYKNIDSPKIVNFLEQKIKEVKEEIEKENLRIDELNNKYLELLAKEDEQESWDYEEDQVLEDQVLEGEFRYMRDYEKYRKKRIRRQG